MLLDEETPKVLDFFSREGEATPSLPVGEDFVTRQLFSEMGLPYEGDFGFAPLEGGEPHGNE